MTKKSKIALSTTLGAILMILILHFVPIKSAALCTGRTEVNDVKKGVRYSFVLGQYQEFQTATNGTYPSCYAANGAPDEISYFRLYVL